MPNTLYYILKVIFQIKIHRQSHGESLSFFSCSRQRYTPLCLGRQNTITRIRQFSTDLLFPLNFPHKRVALINTALKGATNQNEDKQNFSLFCFLNIDVLTVLIGAVNKEREKINNTLPFFIPIRPFFEDISLFGSRRQFLLEEVSFFFINLQSFP